MALHRDLLRVVNPVFDRNKIVPLMIVSAGILVCPSFILSSYPLYNKVKFISYFCIILYNGKLAETNAEFFGIYSRAR